MSDAYTRITKPTTTGYTNINPLGKTQYDQSDVFYDDANVFYDGAGASPYTLVAKPSGSSYTNIAKPVT